MDAEEPSQRRRRATALMALAAIFLAGASLFFLYSAKSLNPKPAVESNNPLLVTRDYVIYSFTSPTAGWALDFGETALNAGEFAIFRTADRGKHWQKQLASKIELPPFSAPGGGPIFSQFQYGAPPVQTVDAEHSFMVVRGLKDVLYHTADAGVHWNTVALPDPYVATIAFVDANYGWMVTSGGLYLTRDAGATWQSLTPPPDAFRLSLRSSTEAWMAGDGPSGPYVYTSSDASQTWHRHDLLPPPDASLPFGLFHQSVVELLPRVGVVVSSTNQGGGPTFRITSFDGGVTWRHVQSPASTVAYEDAFHWWAIGGSAMFKSSDAGQTWIQVTNELPDWVFGPDLHILDAKHAWASVSVPTSLSAPGGYGLAFTDDGGLHWTRAQVPHAS